VKIGIKNERRKKEKKRKKKRKEKGMKKSKKKNNKSKIFESPVSLIKHLRSHATHFHSACRSGRFCFKMP